MYLTYSKVIVLKGAIQFIRIIFDGKKIFEREIPCMKMSMQMLQCQFKLLLV